MQKNFTGFLATAQNVTQQGFLCSYLGIGRVIPQACRTAGWIDWERMDTCICMDESLCYLPETIIALLIGYTWRQNKKLKKKKDCDPDTLKISFIPVSILCRLSLRIVMSTRNAWGCSPGPYYCEKPPQTFPFQSQCCGWTSPCGPYYDCKTHLSNSSIGDLRQNKVSSQVLKSTRHAQSHTNRSWIERVWTWGSASMGIEGGVPNVLWVHQLLVNLKLKSRN